MFGCWVMVVVGRQVRELLYAVRAVDKATEDMNSGLVRFFALLFLLQVQLLLYCICCCIAVVVALQLLLLWWLWLWLLLLFLLLLLLLMMIMMIPHVHVPVKLEKCHTMKEEKDRMNVRRMDDNDDAYDNLLVENSASRI